MAITDELREYAEIVPRLTSDLTAIADRIDAEHAEAQRRWMAELDAAREQSFLREQMERLVTLLRNDCNIDASWDGLRRFWSIELTESGCLMRDRACKAEAENDKLRELCKDMMAFVEDDDACERCGHDAECVEAADGELVLPYEGRCLMLGLFADRMRELGVVVDDGQA